MTNFALSGNIDCRAIANLTSIKLYPRLGKRQDKLSELNYIFLTASFELAFSLVFGKF